MSGCCEVVKCLIDFHAEINLCNKARESPLFAASMYKQCYVVEYLLEHGADVN
jgi:ankyrin repeat protein